MTFSCLTCAAGGRDGSGTVYRGVSEVAGLTGVHVTDGAGWAGDALGWTGWNKIQPEYYQFVAHLNIEESNSSKYWELTGMRLFSYSTTSFSSFCGYLPRHHGQIASFVWWIV